MVVAEFENRLRVCVENNPDGPAAQRFFIAALSIVGWAVSGPTLAFRKSGKWWSTQEHNLYISYGFRHSEQPEPGWIGPPDQVG